MFSQTKEDVEGNYLLGSIVCQTSSATIAYSSHIKEMPVIYMSLEVYAII